MVGVAQAGSTYGVLYGVIGRNVPAERRSWAMGVVSAAGSFGQFLLVPTSSYMIEHIGWHQALLVLAATVISLRSRPVAVADQ